MPIQDQNKSDDSLLENQGGELSTGGGQINFDNDDGSGSEKELTNSAVSISKSKLVLIKKLLDNIKENSNQLEKIVSSFITDEDEARISLGQMSESDSDEKNENEVDGKIIEGVFDGQNMIGPDGKQYSVPSNYASKSKLVEGDILKLTITGSGTFVYKQIGPIERNRVIGALEKNNEGNFYVTADDKKWRILTASVTFFKGEAGDEAVILVPKSGDSQWAAVENIIRKAR